MPIPDLIRYCNSGQAHSSCEYVNARPEPTGPYPVPSAWPAWRNPCLFVPVFVKWSLSAPVIPLPSAAAVSQSTRQPQPGQITRLLARARDGDEDALDELFPLVYEILRRISHRQLRKRAANQSLRTTELVHEAYMKLAPGTDVEWEDRAHFFGVAARAMRQVLMDRARRRSAAKRGGDRTRITLSDRHANFQVRWDQLLALDEALDHLNRLNERLHRVVELRFFGGMMQREIARLLGISTRTVERDWAKARLFLHRELYPDWTAE